jgi:PAS domain S-box-containing protein
MNVPAAAVHPHLARLVEASAALSALPASAGPAAVFEALYDYAAAMFGVRNFLVGLYDRATGLIRCGYAVVEGERRPLDDFPPLPLGSGPVGRVIRTGHHLIIPDVQAETARWNAIALGGGPPVRSLLLVPMTRGGEPVGVVQAQSPRVAHFTADDAAALSVLASQAAAALEAIAQHEQAERATARARLLADVSRVLGESLDLTEVVRALAGQVTAVMGGGCAVFLLAESGDHFETQAIRHRDPWLGPLAAALAAQPPPRTDSFLGQVIQRGLPLLLHDLGGGAVPTAMARDAARLGIRQALLAPIRRQERVLGAILAVGTAACPLYDEDLALATALADRAAAAIDHARLHAALAERRRFLAQLIEAAPIGIAVLRGPDLVYEVANAAFRTLVGTDDDLVGRRFLGPLAHGPRRARYARGAATLLERVRDGDGPLRMLDVTVARKGGTHRFLSFDLSPLPPERGRGAGVLVLLWETTAEVLARERLEQLARQSQAHAAELEAVIAGMAEGVVVTAADGGIRLMNAAARRILGDTATASPRAWELLATLSFRDLTGEPVPDAAARALWQTDRPLVGREFLVRAPDGTDRAVRMSLAPLPATTPDGAGVVAVVEDITERRALDEAREEFLAQASHELRTPLTSMIGYLQMVERRLARNPDAARLVAEPLRGAAGQARRLRALVGDLLDASRIRQGRLELQREPVDLAGLARAVMDDLRDRGAEGRHTLHLDVPPAPVLGEWDAERLRQVLVNLVDNAVKYSPAGGRVWVTVEDRGGEAVVQVRDEGIGIPERELPKLFRPFGRAAHPAARNIPGFGLGLYICRDIVERHGGAITVASRPGHGTTFTVTLPRHGG